MWVKNESLTLNGSHDEDPVMYVDVRRPTIERHPIELERRPEVRSVGTGSILILCLICIDCHYRIWHCYCYCFCVCRCTVDIGLYCSMILQNHTEASRLFMYTTFNLNALWDSLEVYLSIRCPQSVVYTLHRVCMYFCSYHRFIIRFNLASKIPI